MRKGFTVILDADDTLYQCNNKAIELLNAERGTSYTIYDIKKWGMTGGLIDERLKYFNDPDFISSLRPINGAQEFVKKLSTIAEILICTDVKPQCAGSRFYSIIRDFPEIPPKNIIIGGRKDLLVADMSLDDGIHNLENSRVDYPVLFQQPWNYGNTGMLSVAGYDEFLELVKLIKSTRDCIHHYEMVVLIGPSGSGKKQVAKQLIQKGNFERVKTYSTKNDTHYHSLSFEEFTLKKDAGFFSETSIYLGDMYGTRKEDIEQVISKGKIPLMILDINGAVAIRHLYDSLNVFVKAPKEDCIFDLLQRNLPTERAVQRITAIDSELRNEELCDLTITKYDFNKIIDMLKLEDL